MEVLTDRRARALYRLPDDVLLAGVTALQAYGLDLGDAEVLRVVTATTAQTRRADVRLSRVAILPPHRAGLVVPLEAWRGAAADLDLVGLVSAGDALVRRGFCTLPELVAFAESATGRGCRALRRAAGLVRERVDSFRETRLRLCLVIAGLPEPRCNVVLGHDGRLIGRVDLLFDEVGLIVEYDGDQHRDRAQWNVDLDRDDDFRATGFATVRVTRDRMRRPRLVVSKIHARLVERGYRGPAPTFGPEWADLFERRV